MQKETDSRLSLSNEIIIILKSISGLSKEEIDPKATFLEIGLDSLSLAQLAWLLQDKFQVAFSFRELYNTYSTPDSLASELLKRLPTNGRQPHLEPNKPLVSQQSEDEIQQIAREISINATPVVSSTHQSPHKDNVITAPITESQKEIWLSAKLSKESNCAYNESMRLRFQGDLNLSALVASLEDLVQRHEAFRTTFSPDGQTMQIEDKMPVNLDQIDLSELDELAKEQRFQLIRRKHVETPFDLEKGPLFHFELIKYAHKEHYLFMTMHHLICDGWSWDVLIMDLQKLYTQHTQNITEPLPSVEQFRAYATEQKKAMDTDTYTNAQAFWLSMFADKTPALQLPLDRPRPPVRSYNADRLDWELSSDLLAKIRNTALEYQCSLYILLFSAWEVFFHRISSEDDFVIGMPFLGRNTARWKHMVGISVNTLPIRARIDSKQPFDQYLVSRRAALLDAFEHQQITYGSLLEKLFPKRDPGRDNLIPVVINLQTYKPEFTKFDCLDVNYALNARSYETFEIFVNMVDYGKHMILEVQYNTDLMDKEKIRSYMAEFEILLNGIVNNPSCPINQLPILPESERHQLLSVWNRTQADYPGQQSLQELFEMQVQRAPDRVALSDNDRSLTYADLNERANQLAHYLIAAGVGVETLVGICMERSPDWIIGLLAILKAGGAYVPLDPDYPIDRLCFMAQDTSLSLILTQNSLIHSLQGIDADIICLDLDWNKIAHHPTINPPCRTTGDNLAYVMFTSGSTGEPKGTCIEHHSISRLVINANDIQIYPQDTVSQTSNASFDAATFELWGTLLNGAKLVFYPKEVILSPSLFAKRIQEDGVTVMWLTTGLFNHLATTIPDAFGGLRLLLFGGQAATPNLVHTVYKNGKPGRLINGYGPTESTTFASCYVVEDIAEDCTNLPIGKPINNTTLYILDDLMKPVPIGVTGELYIGGDGLSRCYHNRPALTREKFVPNPFSDKPQERLYRTGDLARYRPDGNIEFLGRMDSQVKIRGFRIELGEIEYAINQLPMVHKGLVTTTSNDPEKIRLVAYLILNKGQTPSNKQLRTLLKEKLPNYMIPLFFVFVDEFPLTPNGKVDWKALPKPTQTNQDTGTVYQPPRNPVEEAISRLWMDVLNLDQVSIYDNFFELGGDSLKAIQVMSRLQDMFQIEPEVRVLFLYPQLSDLAQAIMTAPRPTPPAAPNESAVETDSQAHHLIDAVSNLEYQTTKPLFVLAGLKDVVSVAAHIDPNQPIELVEWDKYMNTTITIEEMAENCLKHIRRIQPHGPYLLAGFCFGGYLMFEIACQLKHLGEEISFLGLIDTDLFYISKCSSENNAKASPIIRLKDNLHTFAANYRCLENKEKQRFIFSKCKNLVVSIWRNTIWKQLWTTIFHLSLKTKMSMPAVFKEDDFAYQHALDRYSPKIFDGKLSLFESVDLVEKHRLRHNQGLFVVEKRCARQIEHYQIPGEHLAVFTEPNVGVLAEKLMAAIKNELAEPNA